MDELDIQLDATAAKAGPGDVIVLRSRQRLSGEAMSTARELVRSAFPSNIVLILDRPLELDVWSHEELERFRSAIDRELQERVRDRADSSEPERDR